MTEPMDLQALSDRLKAIESKRAEVEQEFAQVRSETLAHCIALCKTFGFTAKELRLTCDPTSADKPKKVSRPAKAKYRNPNGDETWSGRGAHAPHWFTAALEEGYTKEDMLIGD